MHQQFVQVNDLVGLVKHALTPRPKLHHVTALGSSLLHIGKDDWGAVIVTTRLVCTT